MPWSSQTGTPRHFHSSTTSGAASWISARSLASVAPRQSPSSSIRASISADGVDARGLVFVAGDFVASFLAAGAFFAVVFTAADLAPAARVERTRTVGMTSPRSEHPIVGQPRTRRHSIVTWSRAMQPAPSIGWKLRVKLFVERFWQPTSACMMCMPGSLSNVWSAVHWTIALRTGLVTGVVALLLSFTPVKRLYSNRYGNALVVGG